MKHKKIGVLCHKPSFVYHNNKKEFLLDALLNWTNQSNQGKLCAIFSPEHGLEGTHEAGASVSDDLSKKWGCPVYSLHGQTRAPTRSVLSNIDVLVIDIQEVGLRCYTYLSTLKLAMQAAKENNVKVLLLERPNPIKFWGPKGPILRSDYESFVGKVYTPFMHGENVGTLAKKINECICADLTVLPCGGAVNCSDYFLSNFVPPSPNLNSIDAVQAYPMTVLIEGTNYSEGRGALYPFQQIGAPWIDAKLLAKTLNDKKLKGVFFEPVTFTPKVISGMAENPKHKNVKCGGVFMHIYDKKSASPMIVTQTILKELFVTYPQQSSLEKWGGKYAMDLLIGTDQLRKWLVGKQKPKLMKCSCG